MSRARNLADLLDANGDVASGALDNVPASNDASALTTGTLPIARIADGDITAAKLGSTLDLSGKTVTLPSGVGGKIVQYALANNAGSMSTTSSSYSTMYSASLNGVDAANTVLLIGGAATVHSSNSGGSAHLNAGMRIYNSTRGYVMGEAIHRNGYNAADIDSSLTIIRGDDSHAGGNITWNLQFARWNGNDPFSTSWSYLYLFELAA